MLLGLASLAAWRYLAQRQGAEPPEVAVARERAWGLLRRDDPASKDLAADAFADLVAKRPSDFESRAALVVTRALVLDDARIELRRLQAVTDGVVIEIAKLKERPGSDGFEKRVNALVEQAGDLKKQSDPLVDRATGLDARLNEAFRAMRAGSTAPSPAEERAYLRAEAVYYGVKGNHQVLTLAERYRSSGPADDGWSTVALAEYALNGRVSPDTAAQSRADLQALRAKDSTFLRGYVLSARLALLEGASEQARLDLEAVMLLNPKHDIAQSLLRAASASK